jgi:DNA polymerase-3 subunit delta
MPMDTEGYDNQKAYIIYGDEEYIRQKAIHALVQSLAFQMPELNHAVLERAKVADIIMACETLPFLDEKRLVQVKNFEPLTGKGEDCKPLEDYIPKLPQTTVLLLDIPGKVDKRRRLYKIIEKTGRVVEFSKPALPRLIEIVCQEAKEKGLALSKDTAEALVRQSGQDLLVLSGELDKLASIAQNGKVTKEDIREFASKSLEYDVFSLHSLFMQGKPAKALSLFNQVLETEKSPFGVIGLIASKFRLILKARTMLDARYAPGEIISTLGVHPYAAREAMNDAGKFTAEGLRRSLKALAFLDYSLKSGQGAKLLAEKVLLDIYNKN